MHFLFLVSAFCGVQGYSDINELNRILNPFLAENDLIVSIEDELYKFFNNRNITISLDSDKENYLQIQFNGIKNNVLPECLSRLINIKILILNNNGLNELPEFFEKFTSLVQLNLSSNNFNKLPEALFLLQNNLTHLYLNMNKFKSIEDNIKSFKGLEVLDFSMNDIRTVSEEFGNLTNLKNLNLNGNNNIIRTSENDMDHKKDVDFLNKIPKFVESLYINNTRLRYITCNLKFFPNLLILYVRKNFIKNLFCYCNRCISTDTNYSSSIYPLEKLKELSLSENQVEGSLFIENKMLSALEKLHLSLYNIVEFEVEGYNIMNNLNGEYIEYENPSTKNRSDPSDNALNNNNSEPGIIYSLQHISIATTNIYIVPNLLIFPNLRYLKIKNKEKGDFGITSDKVRSLFDGLSKMELLKHLELFRFNLVTIPELIFNLKNLEYLSLNSCKIKVISNKIKYLSRLGKLSLSYNNIRYVNSNIFSLRRPITIVLANNPFRHLPSSINNNNLGFTLEMWLCPIYLFKKNDNNLGIMDISYKKVKQIKKYNFRNIAPLSIEYLYLKSHEEEYKWELDKMLKIKYEEVKESKNDYNIIIHYWHILKQYITDNDVKDKFSNYLKLLYEIKKREKATLYLIIRIKKYTDAIFEILTNLVNMGNTAIVEPIIRKIEPSLSGCILDKIQHFSYAYHLLINDENKSTSMESFISNKIALLKYHALREIITSHNEEQNLNKFSNWQSRLSKTLGLPLIPQKSVINTEDGLLQCKAYVIYQFFKLMTVKSVVKNLYQSINNNLEKKMMAYRYISDKKNESICLKEYINYKGDMKHIKIIGITEKGIYFILTEMDLIRKRQIKTCIESI